MILIQVVYYKLTKTFERNFILSCCLSSQWILFMMIHIIYVDILSNLLYIYIYIYIYIYNLMTRKDPIVKEPVVWK